MKGKASNFKNVKRLKRPKPVSRQNVLQLCPFPFARPTYIRTRLMQSKIEWIWEGQVGRVDARLRKKRENWPYSVFTTLAIHKEFSFNPHSFFHTKRSLMLLILTKVPFRHYYFLQVMGRVGRICAKKFSFPQIFSSDRAITCMFCRDLYLTFLFSGLLQKYLFKGR